MSLKRVFAYLCVAAVAGMTLMGCSPSTPATPTAAPAAKPAEQAQPAAPGGSLSTAPTAAPKPAAPAQGQPKQGGTLVVGIEGEPAAIDPAASSSLGSTRITRQITETLIKQESRVLDQPIAPIVPGLAEKWDVSPDGKTWTFYLRKGVSFTDGAPFNADAVKVNFDRVMDKNSKYYFQTGAGITANTTKWIDSYSVVDSSTFKIQLKGPFGSFDRAIMHPMMGIISPKALDQWGNDKIGLHLVGTGPFMFKEREPNVKVTIEKNPNYWDKSSPVYLDQVIFRVMADSSARAAALKKGEIDFDVMVLPDFVEDMRKDPNIDVVLVGNPHIWMARLNHKEPLLQDVRVRQALWQAIDREGMAKALYLGTGQAAWQFLPPKNPANRPNFPNPYPYDPAKAKQLLKEAGVPEGTKIVLMHPNEGTSYMRPKDQAQWIQANLKAVGLDCELKGYEWSAWIAATNGPIPQGVHMSVTAWQSISHDPYMLEQLFATAFQAPAGSNPGMYSNPELDKALEVARQEPDTAKRMALYQKAEDIMLKDVPALPVANDFSPRAVRKNVKGLIMGPNTFFDLYGVWLEK